MVTVLKKRDWNRQQQHFGFPAVWKSGEARVGFFPNKAASFPKYHAKPWNKVSATRGWRRFLNMLKVIGQSFSHWTSGGCSSNPPSHLPWASFRVCLWYLAAHISARSYKTQGEIFIKTVPPERPQQQELVLTCSTSGFYRQQNGHCFSTFY